MSNEAKTKEKKEEAANLPATQGPGNALQVIDYGDDAGAGAEGMSRDEFKIPLLKILMSNSPQCKDPSAGGVEGARQGMIFNTATGEMWEANKKPLLFIPVYRDHQYVEFIPREPWGGGFVGVRKPDDPLVRRLLREQGRFGKLKNPEGTVLQSSGQQVPTEIVETYYLFGLIFTEDGQMQQDVVPFTSTQIGKYQNFMTRYNSIRYPNSAGAKILPPLWAHRYLLGTRPEKNKKGEYWGWTLRLESEPPIKSRMRLDDPIYEAGRAFHDLLASGAAAVDREAEAKAGQEGGADGDDIPF